ncbi:MAG TPA: hypothetical protein VLH17_05460 [Candidatus Binatia bacterium]|nr:hypothetical protein [Candidatus Binatia bacterium]
MVPKSLPRSALTIPDLLSPLSKKLTCAPAREISTSSAVGFVGSSAWR